MARLDPRPINCCRRLTWHDLQRPRHALQRLVAYPLAHGVRRLGGVCSDLARGAHGRKPHFRLGEYGDVFAQVDVNAGVAWLTLHDLGLGVGAWELAPGAPVPKVVMWPITASLILANTDHPESPNARAETRVDQG